jgi:hypothetical protein
MTPATPPRVAVLAAAFLGTLTGAARPAAASDLDRPPINYAKAPAANVVTRLQERVAAGKARLTFDDDHGYLKSVLRELNVPESSQVLVFSKTSLQRERIGPKTPRAIYFNDDVYVGFCFRGEVMELSAADAGLGTVFYTLDQEPADRPRFTRQTETCLTCHGSSGTRGFPGHMVRSVFTDPQGFPILSAGSFRTDQASPFKERWGGWYVTGTHGGQTHMGNLLVRDRKSAGEGLENPDGQNVTDLKFRFTTANYLTPHSDIVALMVLEHQAEMHNKITRAALETRMALHYQDELNKALNEPASTRYDSVKSRIKGVGDELVKYLLFGGEAKLTAKVAGSSAFADEFAARGPKDRRGRSLREFDLTTRLFKYPCSYLVYSAAFDGMPADVREYVLRRVYDVLTGKDTSPDFAHLSADDRAAIREILVETKPNLPDFWRAGTSKP